jgi:pilus assembly protein Flp/PilA
MPRPLLARVSEKRGAARLARLFADPSGVTSIEYALIASLVSLAVIGGAMLVGTQLSGIFTALAAGFPAK